MQALSKCRTISANFVWFRPDFDAMTPMSQIRGEIPLMSARKIPRFRSISPLETRRSDPPTTPRKLLEHERAIKARIAAKWGLWRPNRHESPLAMALPGRPGPNTSQAQPSRDGSSPGRRTCANQKMPDMCPIAIGRNPDIFEHSPNVAAAPLVFPPHVGHT